MRVKSMSGVSPLCFVFALASAPVIGQSVYIVPQGEDPRTPPYNITAKGGDVLRLEVWIDDIPAPGLREWKVALPCTADNGVAGRISYAGGNLTTEDQHLEYVFSGLTPIVTGDASGKCPTAAIADLPYALRGVGSANSVVSSVPKLMASFAYKVSSNAEGVFSLEPVAGTCLGAGSYFREGTGGCFSAVSYLPIKINVPSGSCCIDQGCNQTCQIATESACDGLDGLFSANADCLAGCPCVTNSHCDDGDSCTRDICTSGVCSNPSGTMYGDIAPCGGDGFVNLFDLLAMQDALFGANPLCPVCDGSGGECGATPVPVDLGTIAPDRFNLVAIGKFHRKGSSHSVDVFARDIENVQNYSISVGVSGGDFGELTLESAGVDQLRSDYIFAREGSYYLLVDKAGARIDAIQVGGPVTTEGPVYLGTFTFRSSSDATGAFRVSLHTDDGRMLTTSAVKFDAESSEATAIINIR